MHRPQPAEEYITVIDNKGRERIQHVEYIVTDVHGARDDIIHLMKERHQWSQYNSQRNKN